MPDCKLFLVFEVLVFTTELLLGQFVSQFIVCSHQFVLHLEIDVVGRAAVRLDADDMLVCNEALAQQIDILDVLLWQSAQILLVLDELLHAWTEFADISITEIDELAGESSDLHATIEKYDDVKEYKVYLLDNNMVLVITDVLFQEREGYLISEEEQEGVLIVSGMSFDSDMIRIKSRIGDSNIYTFRAGQ